MVVFPFMGSLNSLACLLHNELPAKNTSQVSSSISCLDNKENPFLFRGYQGQKRIYFPEMEKGAVNGYLGAALQAGPFYARPLQPSSHAFALLSIPILQLTTVYRI